MKGNNSRFATRKATPRLLKVASAVLASIAPLIPFVASGCQLSTSSRNYAAVSSQDDLVTERNGLGYVKVGDSNYVVVPYEEGKTSEIKGKTPILVPEHLTLGLRAIKEKDQIIHFDAGKTVVDSNGTEYTFVNVNPDGTPNSDGQLEQIILRIERKKGEELKGVDWRTVGKSALEELKEATMAGDRYLFIKVGDGNVYLIPAKHINGPKTTMSGVGPDAGLDVTIIGPAYRLLETERIVEDTYFKPGSSPPSGTSGQENSADMPILLPVDVTSAGTSASGEKGNEQAPGSNPSAGTSASGEKGNEQAPGNTPPTDWASFTSKDIRDFTDDQWAEYIKAMGNLREKSR